MSSKFSLFLALRYLRPKRTFVSIITLISVMGVTLGVGVLIVVISVMAGFEAKIKEVVLGFEPHIIAEKKFDIHLPFERPEPPKVDLLEDGTEFYPDGEGEKLSPEEDAELSRWEALQERSYWENLQVRLEAEEEILEATPFIEGPVMMRVRNSQGQERQFAPMMRALPDGDSYQVRKIRELMKPDPENPGKGGLGELDLLGPNVVMSRESARKLGIEIGDKVQIISPRNVDLFVDKILPIFDDKTLTAEQQKAKVDELSEGYRNPELTLTGVFDSLRYEPYIIVRLSDGRELYEFAENHDVHGLAIQTKDAYHADAVNKLIAEKGLMTENWDTKTWMEANQLWFEQIRNERAMMYFVLFFIVIVAAFSIMNTMITVTVQKRKEIGVMKALGARESQIIWVFLGQGMVVGFIGTVLGVVFGSLVIVFRNDLRDFLAKAFGMQIFPEGLYGVPEIPAVWRMLDMGIICLGAFVLCTLAALLPAWFAARLDPAKALRE